ncbi:MAG: hypothetical protein LBS50_03625 [Prevotellaceae bacterium]|jgi:DNA-binding Lrp family transcriptional regulator|nr:hypothetical protein [Prevotellaceae bacterium]
MKERILKDFQAKKSGVFTIDYRELSEYYNIDRLEIINIVRQLVSDGFLSIDKEVLGGALIIVKE